MLGSEHIYRAPMRARAIDAPRYAGARLGVEAGIVGIGEPVEGVPADLEEALELTAVAHGHKAARMLRHFAELDPGTLVWTQTGDEAWRLGRIRGSWRWDASASAAETGIHNVREAEWLAHEFGPDEAPSAVIVTFSRGGRNLQRTHDSAGEHESAALWEEFS